jgi:transcriptional regulator
MTYVPDNMRRPKLSDAIDMADKIGFASVIVNDGQSIVASHVPMFVARDESGGLAELRFHVAARNPMAAVLENGPRALVIFRGPDGYISPEWYDHENVPTWDYAFVHVTGSVELRNETDLRAHVRELLAKFDPSLSVREAYIDQYISWIRGFALIQPTVEPVYKLSQDKNRKSVDGVLSGLRLRNKWLDSELAAEIERMYQSI